MPELPTQGESSILQDAPLKNKTRRRARKPNPGHKKLARLPENAKVTKRPLLRPAIASKYAGASQQKVNYVRANTPFLSAVKRVEKLLHLSDKRLVQSAATLSKQKSQQQAQHRGVKRKRNGGEEDEILGIAEEVERQRAKGRRRGKGGEDGEGEGVREEVVIKGTGKAIQRVMELGLWFKQRQEYAVRLTTGSVGAIDDIEVDEAMPAETAVDAHAEGTDDAASRDGEDDAAMNKPNQSSDRNVGDQATGQSKNGLNVETTAEDLSSNAVPETRIRYTSVLEVYISIR